MRAMTMPRAHKTQACIKQTKRRELSRLASEHLRRLTAEKVDAR